MRAYGLVVCGHSNAAQPFVFQASRLAISACLCGLRRCLHRRPSNGVGLITLKQSQNSSRLLLRRLAGTSQQLQRQVYGSHRLPLRVEDGDPSSSSFSSSSASASVSSDVFSFCKLSGRADGHAHHHHPLPSLRAAAGRSLGTSSSREEVTRHEETTNESPQRWSEEDADPSSSSSSSSGTSSSTTAAAAEEGEKKKKKKMAMSRWPGLAVPPPSPSSVATESVVKKMIDVNPPRGTRDFFPEDLRLRNWLFGHFREVSRRFGFEEVDAPVLESEELFVRKAGEEITEQLYGFEDKGNRRMALRPELTPSLARLILLKGKGLPLPVKWSIIGQCWRYERMTRGRRREHYQWNMDIVGVPGVEAEAELLSAIALLFMRLGVTHEDVRIRVSSREVLQSVLDMYDVPPQAFVQVCVTVDKIGKLPQEEIANELSALGVSDSAIAGILSAMQLQSLEELEKLLGSDNKAVRNLRSLFQLADGYGYRDWLQFDASVVRGLAYYTGVVFEAFDKEGKLRAICGGGRYDRLLSSLGGEDTPACGFGFGDAVIVELLKEKRLLPTLPHQVDDIVLAMADEDNDVRVRALSVATKLRLAGRSVDLVLEDNRKMKWAFKHAERLNARRMFIVGSSELERDVVRVKNLETREEADVPLQDVK